MTAHKVRLKADRVKDPQEKKRAIRRALRAEARENAFLRRLRQSGKWSK